MKHPLLVAGLALVAGVLAACSPSDGGASAGPSESPAFVVRDDVPLENQLRDAIRGGDPAAVQALIDAGADVQADFGGGLTPLHAAVMNQNAASVQALIDSGAEVNAVDSMGSTPLHKAAQAPSGEVAQLLIDAGADLAAPDGDRFGRTPAHYAAEGGFNEVLVVLLDAGVDVDIRSAGNGATPFMSAAFSGNVGGMEILYASGADPLLETVDGNTAFGFAAAYGRTDAIAWMREQGIGG
jgi:ankyrin repeat protein